MMNLRLVGLLLAQAACLGQIPGIPPGPDSGEPADSIGAPADALQSDADITAQDGLGQPDSPSACAPYVCAPGEAPFLHLCQPDLSMNPIHVRVEARCGLVWVLGVRFFAGTGAKLVDEAHNLFQTPPYDPCYGLGKKWNMCTSGGEVALGSPYDDSWTFAVYFPNAETDSKAEIQFFPGKNGAPDMSGSESNVLICSNMLCQ